MSNLYFTFKQFTVSQNHSAMKVGTDGVLLGSWIDTKGAKSILDIGAGTGLLSLMLAQRSTAFIDAIEIDADACIDARFNFSQSSWNHRLRVIEGDFLEIATQSSKQYDLIVSNPPFFKNSLQSTKSKRNLARHANSLPHEALLKGVANLLTSDGRFYVVIPSDISKDFISTARLTGLHPETSLLVFSKETDTKPVRTFIRFSHIDCKAREDSLSIYTNIANHYTDEYRHLTKDFYLAF